ncbi:MAG: hypothetical protein PVG14_00500 [Anaerolineales bacterium]
MVKAERWIFFGTILIVVSLFIVTGQSDAASPLLINQSQPTPTGHIATETELALAYVEWSQSAHSDTYDNGMGANTTCARCKSPVNWDPTQEIAQLEASDCGSCKRIPGAPRPELPSGIVVEEGDWNGIPCEVCHIPVGDSYSVLLVFWDQKESRYVPVESEYELCGKCHEGRHGFHVIEEQISSPAHTGWNCSRCHGSHGNQVTCEDCHDPEIGIGVEEHVRHQYINCTACHDAGNLSVWQDSDKKSRHYGEIIPVRFAHALTSWPSHNIQLKVRCQRCHHPKEKYSRIVAASVPCIACHTEGASFFWCIGFLRDPEPPYKNLYDYDLTNP